MEVQIFSNTLREWQIRLTNTIVITSNVRTKQYSNIYYGNQSMAAQRVIYDFWHELPTEQVIYDIGLFLASATN